MDHIKILKRGWQVVKKYRALWWIGLVLVLAGGGIGAGANGGGGAPAGSGSSWRTSAPEWEEPFRDWPGMPDMHEFQDMPDWSQVWEWAAPFVAGALVLIAVLALVAVVVGLVAAIVRYVARVSLMRMVNGYEETGEQVRFKAGFRLGWSRAAWRLFLLDLMLALPVIVVMVLLFVPLVVLAVTAFAGSEPNVALGIVAALAVLPVILLGIALGIVLGPVKELTYRTVSLQDLGPWAAFKETMGLIRRHLGPAALQWLILVGIRIAWGIVLIPVNLVLVFLALFAGGLPGLLVGGIASLAADWRLALVLGALTFVPVFIVMIVVPNLVLKTLATVYHSATWTLTYRELLALDAGAPELDEPDAAELDEPDAPEVDVAEVKAP